MQAKVPGHPWFPAEVGLPEDPGVPQSMLDKKPTGEKMEHHVLVMFFDRHRSWYVLRFVISIRSDLQLIYSSLNFFQKKKNCLGSGSCVATRVF